MDFLLRFYSFEYKIYLFQIIFNCLLALNKFIVLIFLFAYLLSLFLSALKTNICFSGMMLLCHCEIRGGDWDFINSFKNLKSIFFFLKSCDFFVF